MHTLTEAISTVQGLFTIDTLSLTLSFLCFCIGDRTFPCSSCQKRGCAQICPQGEIASRRFPRRLTINIGLSRRCFNIRQRQSVRLLEACTEIFACLLLLSFILANTEELHAKIAEMSERIQQLEDALAYLQSSISADNHPLLRSDLLRIKSSAELHRVEMRSTASYVTDLREENELANSSRASSLHYSTPEPPYYNEIPSMHVSNMTRLAFFPLPKGLSHVNQPK
jgi:hypothetical protein